MIDDPHLRFFTRLTLGRGRTRAAMLVALTAGVAAAAVLAHVLEPQMGLRPGPWRGDRAVLFVAYMLGVFGASLPAARVLELEAAGFLDYIRLSGWPSHRVLARIIVGTMWPYAVPAAALVAINVILLGAPPLSAPVALLVWIGAMDASLWILVSRMRTLPPVSAMEANAVKPFFVWLSSFVAMPVFRLGWTSGETVTRAEAIVLTAGVLLLPILWWRVARRLDRPVSARPRWSPPLGAVRLARLLPRDGPPEFLRQLRTAVALSGGFGLVLWPQLGLLAIIIVGRRFQLAAASMEGLLGSVAVLIAATSGLMVAAMAAQEIKSRSIELVYLTGQRSGAIAAGWYTGMAVPAWIAAAATAATATFVAPALGHRQPFWAALVMMMVVAPAIGLADGLSPQITEGLMTAIAIALLIAPLQDMAIQQNVVPRPLPAALHPGWLIPLAIATAAMLIAAGRLERRRGPYAAGWSGALALAALIVAMRAFPNHGFPRRAVGMMPAFAMFFAVYERPTAPWKRLAIGAVTAAIAAGALTLQAGFAAADAATTAVAAALAFGAGLLAHEAIESRSIGAVLSFVFAIAMQRPTYGALASILSTLMKAAETPPAILAGDVVAIAIAAAAAWAFHPSVRRRIAA